MDSDFENTGFRIGRIRHITPQEAFDASGMGAIFVDVRQPYETAYKAFDVEGLICIPYDEINHRYQELPKDVMLVIADSVGLHSKEVVEFLTEKGFHKIVNLIGGIFDWERDGLPVKINKKEKLTGSCACMLKPHGKNVKK